MTVEQLGTILPQLAAFRFLIQLLSPDEPIKCVVVGASIIDSQLQALLKAGLVNGETAKKMTHFRGSLGEFMSRADTAYCVGWITKSCHRNCQTIAEIRNKIAHDFRHSHFFSPEILEYCDKLALPTGRLKAALKQLWPNDIPFDPKNPVHKFRNVAVGVFVDLSVLTKTQEHTKRLSGERDLWH